MGACSSCLGRESDRDLSDEDEQSRLLFDDHHTNGYGSFGNQNAGTIEEDPLEVQREQEALQKIVAQTSHNLVDVFAMVPQPGLPSGDPFEFQTTNAKSQYQEVLTNTSVLNPSNGAQFSIPDGASNISDGWDSEDENVEETKDFKPVESHSIGPLLGGFLDTE